MLRITLFALMAVLVGRSALALGVAIESDSPAAPFRLQLAGIEVVPPRGKEPALKDNAAELVFWQTVKDSGEASDYEAYLEAYPDGLFAVLARARLSNLSKKEGSKESKPAIDAAVSQSLKEQLAQQQQLQREISKQLQEHKRMQERLLAELAEEREEKKNAVKLPEEDWEKIEAQFFSAPLDPQSAMVAGALGPAETKPASKPEPQAEVAALPSPDVAPGPDRAELEQYLKSGNQSIRRALYNYSREHNLDPIGRRDEFRIHSSKIKSLQGSDVIVEITYSTKVTWNPNWVKRRFLMRWTGEELVLARHL